MVSSIVILVIVQHISLTKISAFPISLAMVVLFKCAAECDVVCIDLFVIVRYWPMAWHEAAFNISGVIMRCVLSGWITDCQNANSYDPLTLLVVFGMLFFTSFIDMCFKNIFILFKWFLHHQSQENDYFLSCVRNYWDLL